MSPKSVSLDKLRKQIDDIDNQLLDLLMQRTDVVEQVGVAKRRMLTRRIYRAR